MLTLLIADPGLRGTCTRGRAATKLPCTGLLTSSDGFKALAAAIAFPAGERTCSLLTRGVGGRRGDGSSLRLTSRDLVANEQPPKAF